MQFWQYCLLVTARLLYMFRTLSASIIRSTKNCSSSHWCMPWVGMIYCISSKDVQGRLPLHYVITYLVIYWLCNLMEGMKADINQITKSSSVKRLPSNKPLAPLIQNQPS